MPTEVLEGFEIKENLANSKPASRQQGGRGGSRRCGSKRRPK